MTFCDLEQGDAFVPSRDKDTRWSTESHSSESSKASGVSKASTCESLYLLDIAVFFIVWPSIRLVSMIKPGYCITSDGQYQSRPKTENSI